MTHTKNRRRNMKYLTIFLVVVLLSLTIYTERLHTKYNKLLGNIETQQESYKEEVDKYEKKIRGIKEDAAIQEISIISNLDNVNSLNKQLQFKLQQEESKRRAAEGSKSIECGSPTNMSPNVFGRCEEVVRRTTEGLISVAHFADVIKSKGLNCEGVFD